MAVLAGLLGMHGLAPGVPTGHADPGHADPGHVRAMSAADGVPHKGRASVTDDAPQAFGAHGTDGARQTYGTDGAPYADRACGHTDGGTGHVDHADGTCAAPGTASAYTPPALTGTASDAPAAAAPAVAAVRAPGDVRGPPDLSELQLLRI
ncbi:DUF6153 family protein [Streptomyces mutabilis]